MIYNRKAKDFVIPSTIEGVSINKLIIIIAMELYFFQCFHHIALKTAARYFRCPEILAIISQNFY